MRLFFQYPAQENRIFMQKKLKYTYPYDAREKVEQTN